MASTQHFVGVDLHKTVLQFCVLDAAGEVIEETRLGIETLPEGLQAVERLTRWQQNGRFAVEALGLNRWFVNACREAKLDIIVVNATTLGLRALGKKTDRRDAREIARRLYLGDLDRHAKTYYPCDKEYSTRKIQRTHHFLVKQRQQLINQIRAYLSSYKIAFPSTVLYTGRTIAKLKELHLPTSDLSMVFQQLVILLEATQNSIRTLAARIREIAGDERLRVLIDMVPQMGPQTAVTVVHELGDVSRFRNSRAVASYAGLVPRVANSADKSHHGRLTKHGSPELRWILNQMAIRLLAGNDLVRRWAGPRLKRMHKNKVRTALARRILVGIYAVLARGEVFSLERCLAIA